MIDALQLYRLSRAIKPTPGDVRSWRESLGLSVSDAGRTLNLSNPSVTIRAYERDGADRAPGPPTVSLMETITVMTLALLALRAGDANRAELYLLEALPNPVLDQLRAP